MIMQNNTCNHLSNLWESKI